MFGNNVPENSVDVGETPGSDGFIVASVITAVVLFVVTLGVYYIPRVFFPEFVADDTVPGVLYYLIVLCFVFACAQQLLVVLVGIVTGKPLDEVRGMITRGLADFVPPFVICVVFAALFLLVVSALLC